MSRPSSKNRTRSFKNNQTRLNVEALESRVTPTANTISGFVYYDANANGLFDPGETPIANSSIELRDLNNVVVGATTTNALGYYEFIKDQSVGKTDATLTKTVTFDKTQTNFQLDGMLDQFDPALGQLQSVEIQHAGSITSEIKVENISSDSASDISGTVSGNLTLTAPNVNDTLTITGPAGTAFHALKYDGATDFGGTSGGSLGEHTADGSKTLTVTGNDINAYVGTGQVKVTEAAVATSHADGGGNLDVQIRSTGKSTVTVIYHYKAYGPLQPGSYKIVQTIQPAGYTDGLESKQGAIIPNTIGTDTITVGLLTTDVPNNNFGELKATSISGHVWYDANNDGIRQNTEALIPGATVTLATPTGPMQMQTDANGFYHFDNLAPGAYTLKETQPIGYLDGKDNAGTKGGTVVNDPAMDQIQNITLQSGDSSENNDFGELKPASLAGHVYFDANNNGIFDPTELPIAGATVTLTGFDDNGPVSVPATTNNLGEYKFTNLRPGAYAITETQPAGYADGKDTIGTPGGTSGNDVFSDIHLDAGVDGVKNDFGEVKPDTPNNPLPKDVGPLGELPILSKSQLLNDGTSDYLDPVLRGQMAFVVGASITLTGQQPNVSATLAGVQQLQNGTSGSAFVAQLWNTDAHRALQANNLYESVLSRAPTAQEKAAAVQELSAGTDQLTLRQNLFVAPAYQQLHPTTDALAQALYKDILNTTAGTTATQSLVQSMANEPLATVVHDLLVSDASLANLIDDAYRQTVRRAATAAEIQTWTPAVKAGTMTLDALAQRLLSSAEFYQLTFNTIH